MVNYLANRKQIILFLALCAITIPAHAEIEPGDLTLTVTSQRNGNSDPFAREMVLLKIHGVYKQPILLEELVQPALANFSWTQLGRDHWSRTTLSNGQNAISFDRTIAIFPHHAGEFIIEPFTHRLTVNDSGERRAVVVHSTPVTLPVARWTQGSGGPDVAEPWWLPAREVTIIDSWNPNPETIKVGESTRRIVTIEAHGMVAEGLPPRPIMRSRGILTFAGPVSRETIVTPEGPLAKATYQWDVKPGVPEVIPLEAITIAWFDTTTRTLREVEIPARQVGGGLPDSEIDQESSKTPSTAIVIGVGFLSFGLALFVAILRKNQPKRRLTSRLRKLLFQAAHTTDHIAFRRVLITAKQQQPELARDWEKDSIATTELSKLERTIYASQQSDTPNLFRLIQVMSQSRIAPRPASQSALRPIDGQIDQVTRKIPEAFSI